MSPHLSPFELPSKARPLTSPNPDAERLLEAQDQADEDALNDAELTAEVLPVQEMLSQLENVNLLAPLVRCSKLPFRHLVAQYDTHITTTPMILAAEFSRNSIARETDFSTSKEERGTFMMAEASSSKGSSSAEVEAGEEDGPSRGKGKRRRKIRGALVAQFAASDAKTFADAAELIHPYVDAIDLNCGCPQKWAYTEKIGSYLLRQPDTVRDIVRTVKGRLGQNYPISIKIRVDDDPQHTKLLIDNAIHAGISHLTIHGRTRQMPSTQPVDLPAIAFAHSLVAGRVPTVANGDAWTYDDVKMIREKTGVRGVMAARGLLANPSLFAGYDSTPKEAVESFVNLSLGYGFLFNLFHRHLAMMLESHFSRPERIYFNQLGSHAGVLDHLEKRGLDWFDAGRSAGGRRTGNGSGDGQGRGIVKAWDGVIP